MELWSRGTLARGRMLFPVVEPVELSIVRKLGDGDGGMRAGSDAVAPGPGTLRRQGAPMEATLDAFGQAVYFVGQGVPTVAVAAAALAAGAAGGAVILVLLVGDLNVGKIVRREVDGALRAALVRRAGRRGAILNFVLAWNDK